MLTEHIAVMDLMVLADALLLPDDDLALATVLKSPLFGLDDDDLFALAWERNGSLRAALREQARRPRFADAAARLDRYARLARQRDAVRASSRACSGPSAAAQRFLARLGAEANDALDEFLNLALDYERRETPSLQGFVAWLRTAQTDVKRDMEIARDEVRVMTVHGAKGLEAPIVILADTTTPPAGPPQRQPRLLRLPRPARAGRAGSRWSGRRARRRRRAGRGGARARRARTAENEYRRLLYVAMTRAADGWSICGTKASAGGRTGCWYDLVLDALVPSAQSSEPADDGDGDGAGAFATARRGAAPTFQRPVQLRCSSKLGPRLRRPPWLDHDAPVEPVPAAPLSPSSA